MLKAIFATVNISILVLLGFLFADITITDNIPTNLDSGESVLIEATITKGNLSGFAKLQLEVPSGLVVTPVNTKGSSFTFSDGKAKFIWMTLPSEDAFVITYNLSADANASGLKEIGGAFSYIENNNRVDFAIEPKNILIGSDVAITELAEDTVIDESNLVNDNNSEIAEDLSDTAETLDVETTETVTDATETDDGFLIDLAENAEGETEFEIDTSLLVEETTEIETETPASGNCYREIYKLSDTEYRVDVYISDLSMEGYAKVHETIAPSFTVASIDDMGAVVTIDGSTIKYIWFDLPKTESIKVSYKTTATTGKTPNPLGQFAYINNNDPTNLNISTLSFSEDVPLLADTKSTAEPETDVEIDPMAESLVAETESETVDPVISEEVIPEIPEVIETTEVAETTDELENVVAKSTSVPDPETGVTYKVQIVAGPNTVGKEYFRSRHNFNENFAIENHEGWVKYTTSSHDIYQDARNTRNRITGKYNFDGPFVTAYNYGERITVQEALMISRQDWIQ